MRFMNLQGADKAERLASRSIPTDAKLVPGPSGCAAYTYTLAGKLYALGFWGSSAKPHFHNLFRDETRRAAHIAEFFANVKDFQARKAAARAAKSAWVNPLKVGDILYTSWGYDQTNVEFYAVTRQSGKRVWVRQIAGTYQETGFMSGNTGPAEPIRFIGEEELHIAQPSGTHGVHVTIDDCRTAWLHTGGTHGTSSYA